MLSRRAGVSLSNSEDGSPLAKSRAAFCEGPVIHVSRLSIALVCYVVLGALTWTTITDSKIRAGTLVILALFAVKSVLRRKDVLHADTESDAD